MTEQLIDHIREVESLSLDSLSDNGFKPLKAHFASYKILNGRTVTRLQRISGGSIIKRFEHTPYPVKESDVICPHFMELKWGYGCPFNCAWCFLKGTLRMLPEKTAPKTKARKKVLRHLLSALIQSDLPELFNTGELCDSLMDERNSDPFSKWILDIFQKQSKHKVLFLTKSGHVKNLLVSEEHSQAIVSFSLNAEKVSRKWEKAPSVKKRINAAAELFDAGWEVRIRIDPMVPIKDWKQAYSNLVNLIFDNFTPSRITLGTLRGLQSTLNNLTDDSWTKYLGGKSSGWGKKTEDELREDMYRHLLNILEPSICLDKIGLCKETVSMFKCLGINFQTQVCNCML